MPSIVTPGSRAAVHHRRMPRGKCIAALEVPAGQQTNYPGRLRLVVACLGGRLPSAGRVTVRGGNGLAGGWCRRARAPAQPLAARLGLGPSRHRALCSARFAAGRCLAGRVVAGSGWPMPAGGQRAKKAARARRDRQRQPSHGEGKSLPRGSARASAWWRRLSLHARWLTAVTALAAVGGLTVGLVAAFTGSPPAGERPYLSFTGCLLTGSAGINAQPAASAWAGLQSAAAATRMQAQYLAVPANAASASPYLASLVVQHCGLVVAAGRAQAAAVAGDASRFKSVRFVVIGGPASGPNVSVVSLAGGAEAVQSAVGNLARAAVAAAG